MFTHKVTYKHLHKGQKVHSVTFTNGWQLATWFVKDINPAFVTLAIWRIDGEESQFSTDCMFEVEMTPQEIRTRWLSDAKQIRAALDNKLARTDIGYHEMANGFISYDLMEMAKYCHENKIKIVGYCTDIDPHPLMYDDILDVGICAEYSDGERFWCHWRQTSLQKCLKDFDTRVLGGSAT